MVYFHSSSWGLSQAGGRPILGGGMSQSTLPALVACDSSSSSLGFPKRHEEKIQANKKRWGGNGDSDGVEIHLCSETKLRRACDDVNDSLE